MKNTVEPIRSKLKVNAIKNILKAEKNPRNHLLFTLGINSALRISDLLALKIKDVLDRKGDIKSHIYIRQKKTGKEVKPKVNKSMRGALEHFFKNTILYDAEDWLFKSLRSDLPLDKVQSWNLVNSWCKEVGLENGQYGTHTLRKTWGYMARKQGVGLDIIMHKLGQSSISVTKLYIGITQDEVNDVEDKINL